MRRMPDHNAIVFFDESHAIGSSGDPSFGTAVPY